MQKDDVILPESPDVAAAPRVRRRRRSYHTQMLFIFGITLLAGLTIIVLFVLYLELFRLVVPYLGEGDVREYMLIWLVVPVAGIVAYTFLASRRNRLARGMRHLDRGDVARAVKELKRIAPSNPSASRLLGDVHLQPGTAAYDPAEGVRQYRAALAILDKGDDTPTRTSDWLRGMLDRLAPLAPDRPEAAELASDLCLRLKDITGAIRFARILPDSGEPNRQADALKAVLRIGDAVALHRASVDEPSPAADSGDDTPGVRVPKWHFTRVEVAQALVIPGVFVLMIILVSVVRPPGGEALGRLLAGLLTIVMLGGSVTLIWWLGSTADRFRIGESHFLKGRYGPAARIFSKLYRRCDPRAAKRLGDMHAGGLGVEKSAARARKAYISAYVWMNFKSGVWGDEKAGTLFAVPGYDDDPNALSDWYEQIESALERLADKGDAETWQLLAGMASGLDQNEKWLRYAEEARKNDPSPDNEPLVPQAKLETGDESVIPELRWRGEAGEQWALLLLARYYCGDAGTIRTPDREEALSAFRDLLARHADDRNSKDAIGLPPVLAGAAVLIDKLGSDALGDDEIMTMAAMLEQSRVSPGRLECF